MDQPAILCLFSAIATAMLVWPLAAKRAARRRASQIAADLDDWGAVERAKARQIRRHAERSRALLSAAARVRRAYLYPNPNPPTTEEEA